MSDFFFPYNLFFKSFYNSDAKRGWLYVKELDFFGVKMKYAMWYLLIGYLAMIGMGLIAFYVYLRYKVFV